MDVRHWVGDGVLSGELREGLGLDGVVSVLQQVGLRWCEHVLQKGDSDLVKKCMEYGVEGAGPGGRPRKTWTGVVQKDCQAHRLNGGKGDAVDRGGWRKWIGDGL